MSGAEPTAPTWGAFIGGRWIDLVVTGQNYDAASDAAQAECRTL